MNEDTPITVGALSVAIKKQLEGAFSSVRVKGEISGFKRVGGHCYLTLKDAGGCIDAVIWQSIVPRLTLMPADGLEVVASARVTTYADRSKYQLVITQLQPAGIGALMQQLEERKQRLAAEGLFNPERKRPIALLPRVVAVITSPTGAVIRDILHRIADRFPLHVLVVPVVVQGATAAATIVQALQQLNAAAAAGTIPRPDVVIVARGGGAFEDLLPFYDEALVRAVAASALPIISAVGHETDTTLIDYAADWRAPTPTAAAEKAVPQRRDLLLRLNDLAQRLQQAMLRALSEQRHALLVARLPTSLNDVLALPQQRLHTALQTLDYALRNTVAQAQTRAAQVSARLRPVVLNTLRQTLAQNLAVQSQRLNTAWQNNMQQQQQRLNNSGQLLESLSYKAVLQRGYAVLSDTNGKPVVSAQALNTGDVLNIMLHDGAVQGRVV